MLTFRRIGHRILFAVGLVVVLGLVGVIVLYAQRQEDSILAQNERALTKVTGSAVQGLQAIMLRRYASIAQDYAARLKRVEDVIDYRILRVDGVEAFQDNATIDQVNQEIGEVQFARRAESAVAPRVLAANDANLTRMLAQGVAVIYYETLPGGARTVTVLDPILNYRACTRCHDDDPPVRGLVKLTTSLAPVEADIRQTWITSVLVIMVALGGILGVVFWVAQRSVAAPIRAATRAMALAASGDLSVSVPAVGGDEIGRMGDSFNRMSRQLQALYAGLEDEQNKLTTIIRGAREGIVVTDAAGRVVLVNPSAVALLGKSEARIIGDGFLKLVDDEQWMEWRLASDEEDARSGLIEYSGRTLMVQASTIRGPGGAIIGSAAILRDVTDEKRLEADLRRMATTDALTGLHNRRHFDQKLGEEFQRWRRYPGAFSIALLDVDHFKRFNDAHGHECGDRVLQAIAGVLKARAEATAIICRFGGEELVAILPDTNQDAAFVIAGKLRQAIEALVIDGLQVTVSIGVAGAPPHQPESAEALLKLADAALYAAKKGGRNRVCKG